MRLEGFNDGDTLYLAWVRFETEYGEGVVEAHTEVVEVVAFSAEHGLVRRGEEAPRQKYFCEVAFRTAAEAWKYCSSRVSLAAARLQERAAAIAPNAEAA